MGLLGTVAKFVGLAMLRSGSLQMKLLGGVISLLASGSAIGGLGGLVNSFQQKGLGDIVSSWISTGANKSITPDQIKTGLGDQQLKEIAQQAGVTPEQASNELTSLLPKLVDYLTPDGKLPEESQLAEVLKNLPKSKLVG